MVSWGVMVVRWWDVAVLRWCGLVWGCGGVVWSCRGAVVPKYDDLRVEWCDYAAKRRSGAARQCGDNRTTAQRDVVEKTTPPRHVHPTSTPPLPCPMP